MRTTNFRPLHTGQVSLITPDAGSFPRRLPHMFRASAAAALLLLTVPALAQTAPNLGSTSPFAIVSETFSNTTAGTVVNGNVCFTTGPAVDPTINGAEETPCDPQKGIDQSAARAELDEQACMSLDTGAVALNGVTIGANPPGIFPPGCYSSGGAMTIATGTTITLSGNGVYIFRPGGSLDPAANSGVVMANGACTNNVFWTPAGGTTIGANAAFVGTVFRGTAAGLSITLGDSASFVGRALAFGSTVTTANNTIAVPEECGAIIVEKQTDPAGSLQSFTFTGDAAGDLTDDGQIVVGGLAPGDYISSELLPAGWELTDIVCDDANSTVDTGAATANFALDAGETVTCVFNNAQQGQLTIIKNAIGGDGSFDFTGNLGPFNLTTASGTAQTTFSNLTPGAFNVAETVPAGWVLTSANCDNGDAPDAITLGAGEAVTCVFTNTLLDNNTGAITIVKQADPSDTGESFGFTGDLGNFSLMHGEFIVETVPPGTYSVAETVPAGWQLDSAVCDDGSPVDAIDLQAGENVTCTFTNSLAAPMAVPVFSRGVIVLIVLMMLMITAVFRQRLNPNRR
ncbi:MAG: ice-binding family protein [Wenzhouxiangellaceae bacterium]|nr:ice-binding family protein [Wenzhouxiangellaceae bacterium]